MAGTEQEQLTAGIQSMDSAEHDPLDEIGDLVGKTLDILGGAAQSSAKRHSISSHDKGEELGGGRLQSIGLEDDMDLLSAGAAPSEQRNQAAEVDPLSLGSELQQEEMYEPAVPQYEDLQDSDGQRVSSAGARTREAPTASKVDTAMAAVDETDATPEGSLRLPLPPAGPSGSQHHIKVTIREGEKVESVSSLGLKSHFIQYAVCTDSDLPGMTAQGMEVKRRFSDFDALHKHLRREYRGLFVPPLPEKSFLAGKMAQDDFLRLRRADLQAFVKALIAHPVLRESEALKIFLLQPGELTRNPAWTYLVNPPPSLRQQQQQQRAGSAGSSLLTSFDTDSASSAGIAKLQAGLGSWMQWMKTSVAQFVPPKRELSAEEVQLRQSKELLQDLEKLLELAVEAARSLCGHQEALCGDVKEIGRTFAMLSRFEEAVQAKVGQYTPQGASAANRATDLNRLAYGAAKQHSVWKTLSIKTAATLVILHDYWVLVPEAIAALDAREAALTQLHLLQDELAAKQHAQQQASTAANKLRVPSASSAPTAPEQRSYQLTQAITRLEAQIKEAQEEYDTLKDRNQAELSRLNLEREADFKRMMATFARTQAELVQASAEMWANLAAQYE